MPEPLQSTFRGRWVKASGNLSATLALVTTWTINETANGVSESAGTFTVTKGGLWLIVANVWGPAASGPLEAHIGSSSTDEWASYKATANAANSRCSLAAPKSLPAGGTFGLWVLATAAAPGDVAGGFNISATLLGV